VPILKYDGSAAAETAAPVADYYGSSGLETLSGTALNESFWGLGGDRMIGGAGDDTYYRQDLKDVMVEMAGGGVDKVVAWASTWLGDYANIENLTVSGDKLYAAGNNLDNIIEGQAGSQQLYGGLGQDVLIGGAGADTFIVVKGEGNDAIQDFATSEDVLRLTAGFTTFDQVKAAMTQVGSDVKINLGGTDGVVLRNTTVGAFTAANFQLQLDPSKLGAMTFHDEFDGSALSLWDKESNPAGTWRPDYGYQGTQGVGSYTLVGNDEKQIYTSPYFRDHAGDFSASPFSMTGDGTLTITAQPSSNPEIFGYGYTSGMISTQATFAQTYGYFEMRADLPEAAGAWPAFWLIPADGSWPPELDVMETLTNDPHGDWTTWHSNATGSHTSNGVAAFIPDTASGFHTYGVLWTATDLVWYVDGVETFHQQTPSDMNKPMFMIANLALGGWGGAITNADLPAQFKIDYIRAYGLGDGGSTAPATPASPPSTPTADPGTGGALPAPTPAPNGGGETLPSGNPVHMDGTAAADTLMGGDADEMINGGGGQDFMRGGAGNDVMSGGDDFDNMHGNLGDDTVAGNFGDDWVVGGQGSDRLFGDDGSDLVYGNLGDDYLDGGAGDDGVVGGQGNDVLFGGAGNDYLTGDRGADTLTGGSGADVFHTFSQAGMDRVLDFSASEGDRVKVEPGETYVVSQVGDDVVIDYGSGNAMTLVHVDLASLPDGWIFGG
jgi:beta-glucanase (GH16 family)